MDIVSEFLPASYLNPEKYPVHVITLSILKVVMGNIMKFQSVSCVFKLLGEFLNRFQFVQIFRNNCNSKHTPQQMKALRTEAFPERNSAQKEKASLSAKASPVG